MNSKIQNGLVITGLLLIAAVGYYLYTQKSEVSLNNSLVDNQAAAETAEFLQRLNELKVIKLDGAVFSDPRFSSLHAPAQVTVPVPVGRANPFLESN